MTAITHVGLSVPDLDRALAWYGDVLGFEALGATTSVRAHEGTRAPWPRTCSAIG